MKSVSREMQKIVVLCVIIIGGASYLGYSLYFQNPKITKAPSEGINMETSSTSEAVESGTSTIPVSDITEKATAETDTADWHTYNNADYGFKINYPPELGFGGADVSSKPLFSLTNPYAGSRYEFWVQNLDGKTLEQVFEEKLGLTDTTYFEWIKQNGGKISSETLGTNSWLFFDGSGATSVQSHYLVQIPGHDAYLIVDLGVPVQGELPTVRAVLSTLVFSS